MKDHDETKPGPETDQPAQTNGADSEPQQMTLEPRALRMVIVQHPMLPQMLQALLSVPEFHSAIMSELAVQRVQKGKVVFLSGLAFTVADVPKELRPMPGDIVRAPGSLLKGPLRH